MTFPRRLPTSTKRETATTRSARPSPTSPSTAAGRCWPPGWPRKRRTRPTPRSASYLRREGSRSRRRNCSSRRPPPPWPRATRPRPESGPVRRAGCSGPRDGPSGRRAPASSSPRPGTRPASIPPRLFRYAEEVAARLDASRAGEAMQAHLLAGRIALSRGSVTEADPHLERAARSRRRGPPLTRSVAWLARALQADARGNARATVAACARGLDALEEHQMTARGHRVARVRHGARRRVRHAGPARRAQAWRRPPAAVLERAMASDRAGRPGQHRSAKTRSSRPSWKRCAA